MATVERGNVVLNVPDQDVQHYVDKGYNVIGADGNVIQQGVPKDLNVLQKAFIDNRNEIKELKAEIERLKAEKVSVKKPGRPAKAE